MMSMFLPIGLPICFLAASILIALIVDRQSMYRMEDRLGKRIDEIGRRMDDLITRFDKFAETTISRVSTLERKVGRR